MQKKILMSLFLTVTLCTFANADCGLSTQNVPFQLVIPKNCTVTANYSFGTHYVIFCFNVQNPEIKVPVSWSYRGKQSSGTLPIQLKICSAYDGYFADKQGTLRITNNNNSGINTYSCQFAL